MPETRIDVEVPKISTNLGEEVSLRYIYCGSMSISDLIDFSDFIDVSYFIDGRDFIDVSDFIDLNDFIDFNQ